MNKKVLVTGGAGYIGSACVQALIAAGHQAVVLDNFSTGQRDKVSAGAEVITGDLTDRVCLQKVFAEHHFDAVMHFAAKKAVGESEADPAQYFYNNVVGSLNLLEAMSAASVPQLVFSSTAAVYASSPLGDSLTEASPLSPMSVYGLTKLMTEEAIQTYARLGKIRQFTTLRYFNVAGDAGLSYREDNAQNVFPILAKSVEEQLPFLVFGNDYTTKDGTGVRDYIHLADLAEAHLLALESEKSDTYNLGTGTGYSVLDLVNTFSLVTGEVVITHEAPRRAGDPDTVVADATKAKNELGWQPKKTLTEMVEDTWQVYQK